MSYKTKNTVLLSEKWKRPHMREQRETNCIIIYNIFRLNCQVGIAAGGGSYFFQMIDKI